MTELSDSLRHIVAARVVHPELCAKIELDASLERDLRLDDVDLISILFDIEEAHGFDFPQGTELRLHTVRDIRDAAKRMGVDP